MTHSVDWPKKEDGYPSFSLILRSIMPGIQCGKQAKRGAGLMRNLTAFALAILAGCASPVSITPIAGEGQQLTYRRGEPLVASSKVHTVALQVQSAEIDDGKVAEFGVGIHNRMNSAMEFSTENVSATWKGQPLKVYSFEELMAEEKSRQSLQSFGLAMQAFGAGLQSGQQARPVQGTIVSPSGTTTYSGTETYNNPGAAAAAQRSSNANLQAFNADSKAKIASLERSILRRHTVDPGGVYAGAVRIQMPSVREVPERITVTVTASPDTHTFVVEIKPLQK